MDLTIVVVDDDPDIVEFLELLLSMHGTDVVSSDYSGDVVELIARTRPGLVLLDLQYGEDRRAGLDVLARLRADPSTAALTVFVMTADHNAQSQHGPYLHELGASLLLKPFEPDRLWQMIEEATA